MLISYSTIPVLYVLNVSSKAAALCRLVTFPYNRQILGHLGRFGQASVTSNFKLQLLGINFLHSCISIIII